MKTIAKWTVAGSFLLSVATAVAGGPEKKGAKNGITVSGVEANVIELLDPVFSRKGDKLYMNLLNLDLETVKIKVYDSEGRLVYSDKNEGEKVVQKAFNFEKAFKDTYTIVIIDGDKKFKETVTVK